MNKRRDVTFVIPDGLGNASAKAVKLCELFIGEILDAVTEVIEIKVDQKKNLVESNDSKIKQLISMFMKAHQLDEFYEQLVAFSIRSALQNEAKLKLIVDGQVQLINLRELAGLPNLHLRISKVEVLKVGN